MKQKLNITCSKAKISVIDIIDMLSVVKSAEHIAEELINRHGDDIKKIKKEISSISVPVSVPHFNFKDEVMWAVKWIIYKKSKGR